MIRLHLLIFTIFISFSSFAQEIDWENFNLLDDCPQGVCIEPLITEFETLSEEAREENCMPVAEASVEEIAGFFEDNPHGLECLNKISRLQTLSEHLELIEAEYETLKSHATNGCYEESDIIDPEFLALLEDQSTENMCTPEKAEMVSATCKDDVMCAMASSATAAIGPLIRVLGLSESVNSLLPGEGCDVSDDNCLARAASGFLKAAGAFLTGTWDLLKMGGAWIKDSVISGWKALWKVEDRSSTAALAAAEASTDESVFAMLKNDFSGTMANMWGGLVGMIKHWMANDVYCEKWSGQPHFSECLEPYPGFDCMSCKTMINGTCNAIGAILSEVVPAFLTGGVITAAKYGISGAAKLAKTVKLSEGARKALKASQVDKLAQGTSKAASSLGRGIGRAWNGSISKLKSAVKSPLFVTNQKHLKAFNDLASKGTRLVISGTQKYLRYGGKALLTTGKVLIYPIENPLTVKSFNLGMTSVERMASLGSKGAKVSGGLRLAVKSDSALAAIDEVDQASLQMQRAQFEIHDTLQKRLQNGSDYGIEPHRKALSNFEAARNQYLQKVQTHRKELFNEVVKNSRGSPEFDQIIDEFFPELRYDGELAKTLSSSRIRKAERDINTFINQIDDPALLNKLKLDLNDHKASLARNSLNVDDVQYFTRDEIAANAQLSRSARLEKAYDVSGIDPLTLSAGQKLKFEKALQEAHFVGSSRGATVFSYTADEILQKSKILKEAGFTQKQSRRLLRSGLAGEAPLQDEVLAPLLRLARQQENVDVDHYQNFLKVYRKEANQSIKAQGLEETVFSPQNFMLARTPAGKTFYVLKDGDRVSHWRIFTTDGKKIGLFGSNQGTFENMPSKFGETFLLEDGRKITAFDSPRGRYTDIKSGYIDSNFKMDDYLKGLKSEVASIKNSRFDKEGFNKFLDVHQETLEQHLKGGRLKPSEIDPRDFKVATNIDNQKKYFIFEKKPLEKSLIFSTDGKHLKGFKDNVPTLQSFASESLTTLRYTDGYGVRFSLTPKGVFNEPLPVASNLKLPRNETISRLKNNAQKLQIGELDDYEKMLDQYFDTLIDLNYRGDADLFSITPRAFTSFKGTDGNVYWLLKNRNSDPDNFLVLPTDKSNLSRKRKSFTTLREFSNRDKEVVNFRDGTKAHFWDTYKGQGAEYIDNSVRTSTQQVQSIIRKFDIVDEAGSPVNREFTEFLKNKRTNLEHLIQKKKIFSNKIAPHNFKSMTFNGKEYHVLFGSKNTHKIFLFEKGLTNANRRPLTLTSLAPQDGQVFKFTDGSKITVSKKGGVPTTQYVDPPTTGDFKIATKIGNSQFTIDEKFNLALKQLRLKRETLGEPKLTQLRQALAKANDVGRTSGRGLYSYTDEELSLIKSRLVQGGFEEKQADFLIRSGIAARPPTRSFANATGYFADEYANLTRLSYSEKKKLLSKYLRGNNRSLAQADNESTGFFGKIKSAIGLKSSPQMSPKEFDQISKNLDALYFIDYKHSSRGLFDVASGKTKLHSADFSSRYDANGKKPFENFRDAQTWLMDENPPISMDTFKKIQSKMMKGGVEELKEEAIGQVRKGGVIGNVRTPIDAKALEEINNNPYLGFEVASRLDGKVTGKILYPKYYDLSDEAIRRLKTVDADLAKELSLQKAMQQKLHELQRENSNLKVKKLNFEEEQNQLQRNIDHLKAKKANEEIMEAEIEELDELLLKQVELKETAPQKIKEMEDEIQVSNQKYAEQKDLHDNLLRVLKEKQQQIAEGLTKERIAWFNKARDDLGPLDSPEALDEYTDILAHFQRDLVSIHPFLNGNGRSTRQFALYYPLMREGFPPPRILNPDNDLFTPIEVWKKEIKDGIIASNQLMDDLILRSQIGLPLENSPDLIAPMRRKPIELDMIRDNTKNPLVPSGKVEALDDNQYVEYVKRVINENPELNNKIVSNPTAAWEEIHDKAIKLYKENNAYYDYRRYKGKERVERLQLGVADQDFRTLYGDASYDDPVKYAYKMDTWYQDEVNWRGLATLQGRQPKSQEELIGLFKQLSPHMTSNNILRARTGDPDKIRSLAMANIDEYEKALIMRGEGDLAEVAKWHSEAINPHYGNSIGYSTSQDRKVGKAFAMGAMVVADYGKHWDQQEKIAQRVLVGARRSVKDVDLMRLKKLRSDFSYKYFRQKEVMGIGAADPDSIMIVQILDETGEASKTYLRDPENPWRIQVIKGEAEVGESLEVGDPRLSDVIDLRQP